MIVRPNRQRVPVRRFTPTRRHASALLTPPGNQRGELLTLRHQRRRPRLPYPTINRSHHDLQHPRCCIVRWNPRGYWQLAHTAFKEGEVAAENIAGHHVEMSGHAPRCIYTDPEVAAVGLTEAQARETYGDSVVVGSFPFAAIARAAMYADKTGFVKTIHAGPYDELVGVVVVGINATEIINAGVIALDAEATIETVADSIAAHPTLAEGFKEAGLVALGRPIHLPPIKKRTEGAKT